MNDTVIDLTLSDDAGDSPYSQMSDFRGMESGPLAPLPLLGGGSRAWDWLSRSGAD